jgi:hypothetical protein
MADGGDQGNPGIVMPYRKPRDGCALPDWQEELNATHRKVRARVEHALAEMKNWEDPPRLPPSRTHPGRHRVRDHLSPQPHHHRLTTLAHPTAPTNKINYETAMIFSLPRAWV